MADCFHHEKFPSRVQLDTMLIPTAKYSIYFKIQMFLPAHDTVMVLYSSIFLYSVASLYKCHIM